MTSYGATVPTRELRHAIPDVYAGCKELIALAIAVSKECDGCIATRAYSAAAEFHADRQA